MFFRFIFSNKNKDNADKLKVQLHSREFELDGKRWKDAICDVVLPGVGWVHIIFPFYHVFAIIIIIISSLLPFSYLKRLLLMHWVNLKCKLGVLLVPR